MTNPYGITLDDHSLRWAAAEGVPESVIGMVRVPSLLRFGLCEPATEPDGAQLNAVNKDKNAAWRQPRRVRALAGAAARDASADVFAPSGAGRGRRARTQADALRAGGTSRLEERLAQHALYGHATRPAGFGTGRLSRSVQPADRVCWAMANSYGITLDDHSLRWAAAEGVPEAVIAAICLLGQKSIDEIVSRLSPAELEQVIEIVSRSPRGYPPGAYAALKDKRELASPPPQTGGPPPKVALKKEARRPPKRAINEQARPPQKATAPHQNAADGEIGTSPISQVRFAISAARSPALIDNSTISRLRIGCRV
jgi:hypothetical protein